MAERNHEETAERAPRGGLPAPVIGVAVAALVAIGLIGFFAMREEGAPETTPPIEPVAGGEAEGPVSMQRDGVRIPETATERIEGDALATEAEQGEQVFEGTGEDPDLMQPGQNTVNEGEAGPDTVPGPADSSDGQ
jgi:hypothetical protein